MVNNIKNEYFPESVSCPGGTILDLLEEKGMSQSELAERMGRPKKTINEILKGKTAITPDTAIQLERVFGTPASFWNNRQKRYSEYLASVREKEKLSTYIDWLKSMPIREMIKLGWIPSIKDEIAQLSEVLIFFGVNSPTEWKNIWLKEQTAYKQSPAFERKPEANSVWLRRGEIEAQRIYCNPFDKEKFIKALKKILPFTKESPENFEKDLIGLCADAGVAVVFIPPLKGVPVYGATRWLTPQKALIQLSLYRKYEDYFWFSFFHEAGHILLHGKRDIFIEEKKKEGKKENEADAFAREFLIPMKKWLAFITSNSTFSETVLKDFAHEMNISSAIVVGRLQRERKIPFYQMNELRRKFRFQ
ncbi:MAG: HigA family addiction module antidote protein [Candidatus Cloacimonetes bacterium]|nr:HigA family addiction module antidote protein [Candidatus Cloacimonadota bacterium]